MLITKKPKGIINVPSSKSFAHRALISSFIYLLKNIENIEDLNEALGALTKLDYSGEIPNDILETKNVIKKVLDFLINKTYIEKKDLIVNINESGSTLRFLIPIFSFLTKKYNFKLKIRLGDRLKERSLKVYEDLFKEIKSNIFSLEENLLTIKGDISKNEYVVDGNDSSQFITGLIFLSCLNEKETKIIFKDIVSSKPYLLITKKVLADFSFDISLNFDVDTESVDTIESASNDRSDNNDRHDCTQNKILGCENKNKDVNKNYILIKNNQKIENLKTYKPEADYSSGAFLLAMASLGADIKIKGLPTKTVQGDAKIIEILTKMGAEFFIKKDVIEVKAKNLFATTVDIDDTPDLLPVLSVVMSTAHGTSKIINAKRLRDKESDRLISMKTELNKLGADVEIKDDSLIIKGVDFLVTNTVDSHNDHRVFMALACAYFLISEDTRDNAKIYEIKGEECVKKSFPDFLNYF